MTQSTQERHMGIYFALDHIYILSAVKADWVFFGRIYTSVACNSARLCARLWFIELPNHI